MDIKEYKSVVILTGAGVSKASGIRTYRGRDDGLWNEESLIKYSSHSIIKEDPIGFWKFNSDMRKICQEANPNLTHDTLADFEAHLDIDQKLTIITQNIDGLHLKAGNFNVIELHGSIHKTKCSNFMCDSESIYDEKLYYDELPKCPICGELLRPDIVLFEEFLSNEKTKNVLHAFSDCDLFMSIGTSASVSPANKFVEWAWKNNAKTVFINTESIKNSSNPTSYMYNVEYIGKAEEIVPNLFNNNPLNDSIIINDEDIELLPLTDDYLEEVE